MAGKLWGGAGFLGDHRGGDVQMRTTSGGYMNGGHPGDVGEQGG